MQSRFRSYLFIPYHSKCVGIRRLNLWSRDLISRGTEMVHHLIRLSCRRHFTDNMLLANQHAQTRHFTLSTANFVRQFKISVLSVNSYNPKK